MAAGAAGESIRSGDGLGGDMIEQLWFPVVVGLAAIWVLFRFDPNSPFKRQ